MAALQSGVISAANLLDFYEVEDGAAAGTVLRITRQLIVINFGETCTFQIGVLPCRCWVFFDLLRSSVLSYKGAVGKIWCSM